MFGGGTKPLLDANVQKIVDAGFSEEQAENALKYTKNNVDRALKILQKRDNSENRNKEKPQKEQDQPKRKGRNKEPNDEDSIPAKPTGKVSLFDFLEDKLPNVPDRDKSNRPNTSVADDRSDRAPASRDRNNTRNNSRSQGSRYDNANRNRPDNRGYYNDGHHRDDRKYQTQNEKPPRFQRKLEERNKQHQQHQANNIAYSNSYQSQPQIHYNDRNIRNDSKSHQQNYRNNTNSIDGLVDATANLNLLSSHSRPNDDIELPRSYLPHQDQQYPQKQGYITNQNIQEIPPFRRGNDMHKYQDQSYQQRQQQQPNGYIEPQQSPMYPNMSYMSSGGYAPGGRQYSYGRAQEYNTMRGAGPFLPGSLLGFQNAAVNEQARAMLGVAEINWKVGDRCLALYWEDNNVRSYHLFIDIHFKSTRII